ncbi:hypothetical protein KFL_002360030 [Klebsormidium nitens]|uniref:Uncharacterized protein n=1 Tax=Klebsormidium nitens TaxID=105231 RepID=A0A0U9I7M1_KLENI|nr:hypothetical protein KFL_002360030 [Klebsormidium nitens]|eukprot:GAQ85450.1 hypothetical protein KFL_002360030 [Klebsormidium nitens]
MGLIMFAVSLRRWDRTSLQARPTLAWEEHLRKGRPSDWQTGSVSATSWRIHISKTQPSGGGPRVEQMQKENGSAEEELRLSEVWPDASARAADPMDEVEGSAADGVQPMPAPVRIKVAGSSKEKGGGSPGTSANKEGCMHVVEGGAVDGAQTSGGIGGLAKEGGGSPGESAHMEGHMHAVEGGAADGAQSCAGLVKIGVAGSSAKEGGGSPCAKVCMGEVENGAASDAESSADKSCDSGPVPGIGVAAERLGGQNKNGQGQEGRRGEAIADSESGVRESSEQTSPFAEPDLEDPELRSEVVRELEKLLSTWGDNTSIFCAAKPSSTGPGVIYEFRNVPGGRVTCPYFPATRARVHESTNFGLLRRGSEVTYICHGESCKATPQSGNFRLGVLPPPIAAAFGDSQPLNSERDHLYSDRQLLPLPFLRENLNVKKGDVGGALILERLYVRSHGPEVRLHLIGLVLLVRSLLGQGPERRPDPAGAPRGALQDRGRVHA